MRPEGGVDGPRRTSDAAGTSFDTTSNFHSRAPLCIEVVLSSQWLRDLGRPGLCDDAVHYATDSASSSFIKTSGHRAIGIALRPRDFIGDVLGKNRCHGSGHHRTARRGGRGALQSLPSLRRSSQQGAPLKHQDYYAQGGSSELSCMRRMNEKNLLFQDKLPASPLGASVMPNLESDISQF